MARKIEVEIAGDASSLQRAFGQASKSSSGLGRSMASLGKHAAVAGAVLGGAAIVGITKSVQAASNLEEQINKANVVFGKSGKEVIGWSKTLVSNFGLSSRAALEAAGTFGNMLVPMGFTRTEAGKMSKKFVELAGDMASFNNASPEDTLLAIRSGIAGQSEPLRRFGVFLNEARVASEGVALGLVKQGQKMTEAQKATARYSLIMKDTSDTQGDFARTSDSLANAQRTLSAGVENIAAQLGAVFLPAVAGAVSGLSKFVSKISEAEGIKAKLTVVWEGLQSMARDLWEKIVSAVQAINWSAVAKAVQSGVRSAFAALGDLFAALADAFAAINWSAIGQALSTGIQQALAFLGSIDYAGIIGQVAGRITEAFTTLVSSIDWHAFGQSIGKFVTDALNNLAAFVQRTDWNKVGQQMVEGFKMALKAFAVFLAGVDWLAVLGATFRAAVAVIRGLFGLFLGIMQELGLTMLRGLGLGLAALGRLMLSEMQKIPSALRTVAGNAPGWAKAIGVAILIGLGQGLVNLVPFIVGKLAAIARAIASVAGQAAGWAAQIGSAIVRGILSGMSGLFSSVKDKIIGGVQGAIDSAMGIFGGSPQKVIGHALATEIAAGVGEKASVIEKELIEKVKAAIARAKEAVGTARGDFASAFGELASTALQAFDAVVSNWVPPAQKRLDAMNLKQQIEDLKSAITQGAAEVKTAQDALSAAMVGGDPAEIASAQAAVLQAQKRQNDAIVAQEEFGLAQRAAKQQEAHDKKMARQRLRLQEELSDLQSWLGKHPAEYEKVQAKITALLKQNGVDAKFWGSAVGISLAAGLSETEGAVRKAAAAIAKAIARYLKLKSPAEEGELADLDKWFQPFADTLLKGIDFEAVRRAGTDLGEAAKGGWESSLQTLKTFTLGTNAVGLTLPPPDIVPTTEALATVGESTTAVTAVVDKFRDTVTALPAITSQAFQAVAVLIQKAVAPLAKALEEPREAIQAVADALHAIGRAAYATRAALQDTVDDIIRLLNKVGSLSGGSLAGRAAGGPVKKGTAYIVGELGPELFVPRVSGNIVPASDTGTAFAGMGGGVTFNFPNYVGSRDELIREVRRGLLKIDQYNPGSAIARS